MRDAISPEEALGVDSTVTTMASVTEIRVRGRPPVQTAGGYFLSGVGAHRRRLQGSLY